MPAHSSGAGWPWPVALPRSQPKHAIEAAASPISKSNRTVGLAVASNVFIRPSDTNTLKKCQQREGPNVKHQRARAEVSRVKDELSLRALRCMR